MTSAVSTAFSSSSASLVSEDETSISMSQGEQDAQENVHGKCKCCCNFTIKKASLVASHVLAGIMGVGLHKFIRGAILDEVSEMSSGSLTFAAASVLMTGAIEAYRRS